MAKDVTDFIAAVDRHDRNQDRPQAGKGTRNNGKFGPVGQLDHDSVTAVDAPALQADRHSEHSVVKLPMGVAGGAVEAKPLVWDGSGSVCDQLVQVERLPESAGVVRLDLIRPIPGMDGGGKPARIEIVSHDDIVNG
jgi:hypothetical protein